VANRPITVVVLCVVLGYMVFGFIGVTFNLLFDLQIPFVSDGSNIAPEARGLTAAVVATLTFFHILVAILSWLGRGVGRAVFVTTYILMYVLPSTIDYLSVLSISETEGDIAEATIEVGKKLITAEHSMLYLLCAILIFMHPSLNWFRSQKLKRSNQ